VSQLVGVGLQIPERDGGERLSDEGEEALDVRRIGLLGSRRTAMEPQADEPNICVVVRGRNMLSIRGDGIPKDSKHELRFGHSPQCACQTSPTLGGHIRAGSVAHILSS
jgi:hypothetical protein